MHTQVREDIGTESVCVSEKESITHKRICACCVLGSDVSCVLGSDVCVVLCLGY